MSATDARIDALESALHRAEEAIVALTSAHKTMLGQMALRPGAEVLTAIAHDVEERAS